MRDLDDGRSRSECTGGTIVRATAATAAIAATAAAAAAIAVTAVPAVVDGWRR